jgi:hypothetical protein
MSTKRTPKRPMTYHMHEPAEVWAEVRCNADGSLDEVVTRTGGAHLEQMSDKQWFLLIGPVAIWLHSKGRITANWENRGTPNPPTGVSQC